MLLYNIACEMKQKTPNNAKVEQLIFDLSTFMWNEIVLLQFIVSWRADVFQMIFQHLFPNVLTNFRQFPIQDRERFSFIYSFPL